MNSDGLLRRLPGAFKGEAVYLYGVRGGAILLQSVTLFVVAAVIDIEQFGRFSFMFSAAQLATVVLGAGSPLLLQRVLPARDVTDNGIGNTRIVMACLLRSLLLAILLLGVLTGIVWLFRTGFDKSVVNQALMILLTGFLLSYLYVFIAVVRVARSATSSMLLRDLVPYLFFLAGFGVAVVAGYGSAEVTLLIYCASVLISIVLSLAASWGYLRDRLIKDRIAGRAELTEYMAFWGSSIAGAGISQVDILLARVFLDDRALGIYSIMRRVSNLVSMPQVIANWTINVRVAKDYALGDRAALQRHARYGLMLSLPVAVALLLLIAVSSPLWFGFFEVSPTFEALVLLVVLLFAQLVNVLAGANALFAVQCKEERYILIARLVALGFGVIAITIGALFVGSLGIAISTLLTIAILNILLLYRIKQRIGVWTSLPIGRLGANGA